MNRETRRDLLVFSLLLAFGVLGRWAQPAWNFTPLAAVTAIGAFYFRSWLPAILLPSAMLVVSDVALDPHYSRLVLVAVHASSIFALAFGRLARNSEGWRRALAWGLCGFVPATGFYLVTNFAEWASGNMYGPTLAELARCYANGLPFYRTMLAGDVCYVALAAACLAAAHVMDRRMAALERAGK